MESVLKGRLVSVACCRHDAIVGADGDATVVRSVGGIIEDICCSKIDAPPGRLDENGFAEVETAQYIDIGISEVQVADGGYGQRVAP